MKPWRQALPFFERHELACKGTGALVLDPRFAVELQMLRLLWGKPLTVNSCCRSPVHNEKIGGHPRSMHLTVPVHAGALGTMAIDISVFGWLPDERNALVQIAKNRGWSVGSAKSFVHLDRRIDIGMARTDFSYGPQGA